MKRYGRAKKKDLKRVNHNFKLYISNDETGADDPIGDAIHEFLQNDIRDKTDSFREMMQLYIVAMRYRSGTNLNITPEFIKTQFPNLFQAIQEYVLNQMQSSKVFQLEKQNRELERKTNLLEENLRLEEHNRAADKIMRYIDG